MTLIHSVQQDLFARKLYTGAIDGHWGPKTQAAFTLKLRKDGVFIPPWMIVAERELGTKEVLGSVDNPRIVEYHSHTSLRASDDETPWCSSFENYIMDIAGLSGTHSAAAKSWLSWGTSVSPRYGAVVITTRGNRNSPLGHVTNLLHWDSNHLVCLGGNQGDSVSVNLISRSTLLDLRWPTPAQLAQLAAGLR